MRAIDDQLASRLSSRRFAGSGKVDLACVGYLADESARFAQADCRSRSRRRLHARAASRRKRGAPAPSAFRRRRLRGKSAGRAARSRRAEFLLRRVRHRMKSPATCLLSRAARLATDPPTTSSRLPIQSSVDPAFFKPGVTTSPTSSRAPMHATIADAGIGLAADGFVVQTDVA